MAEAAKLGLAAAPTRPVGTSAASQGAARGVLDPYPAVRNTIVASLHAKRDSGVRISLNIVRSTVLGITQAEIPEGLTTAKGKPFQASRGWCMDFLHNELGWTYSLLKPFKGSQACEAAGSSNARRGRRG
ncbi:hypothetical protein ABPG75_011652 [Micractinium tetrahymenae]